MNMTGAFRHLANVLKSEIRTCVPAQIESFDSTNLTVNARPLIDGIRTVQNGRNLKLETGEAVKVEDYTLPSLLNVPVSILWFGEGGITVPIVPGAQGLLLVCDRDIRRFKDTQEQSPQASLRRFDMNDSIFLPFLPKRSELTTYNNDAVEVCHGATKLAVAADGISITGNVTIDGTLTTTGEATINNIPFTTHTHMYSPGPGTPTDTGAPST